MIWLRGWMRRRSRPRNLLHRCLRTLPCLAFAGTEGLEAVMEGGKSFSILSRDALETEDGDTTRPEGAPWGAAGPALGSEDTVASKAPRLGMERSRDADPPSRREVEGAPSTSLGRNQELCVPRGKGGKERHGIPLPQRDRGCVRRCTGSQTLLHGCPRTILHLT